MKRTLALASLCALAIACGPKSNEIRLIPSAGFETVIDGQNVGLYTLRGASTILQVTNFGARVVSIFTPDRDGVIGDIVVGHDNVADYVTPPGERFLGACVGPVANRIGLAKFTLDGTEYSLPANDHELNTLHGGFIGLDNVVWDVKEVTDSTIALHYLHPDGQEGYPGNLDIDMKYSLTSDGSFKIDYRAITDKLTPVNITNHPFFNLQGEGIGSVEDYDLYIKASRFIPIDSLSIPTGEIASVEGNPFDFRKMHKIGDMISQDNEQLKNGNGYDHNWCIDKETDGVELICTVYDPVSGRQVDVLTDQPGLQFYSGNFFKGTETGKYGRPLGFRSSLALEAQNWPDAPNQPSFPQINIAPDQVYTQTTIYKFSAK